MKKLLILLTTLCCFTVFAETYTMDWYMDGETYAQTTCQPGDDVILPQTPYKYGYTFDGWITYTPIEYLESTGTQYIDTGIFPKGAHTKVEIEASCSVVDAQYGKHIFGSRDNVYVNGFSMSFFRLQDNKDLRVLYGANYGDINSRTSLLNQKITLTLDKGIFTGKNSDGSTIGIYSGALSDFTGSNSATLFAWNTGESGIINDSAGIKIYSCKIYDDNILVRDFIPVLDKDGTPCMYDKVTKQFFYNQGTGNFIAGPAI